MTYNEYFEKSFKIGDKLNASNNNEEQGNLLMCGIGLGFMLDNFDRMYKILNACSSNRYEYITYKGWKSGVIRLGNNTYTAWVEDAEGNRYEHTTTNTIPNAILNVWYESGLGNVICK